MRLGEILVAAKACDEEAINRGMEHARAKDVRLGSALIDLGLVPGDTIAAALGKQHGISPAPEAIFAAIQPDTIALLTGAKAHAHKALPLGLQRTTGELAVAMRDPQDLQAIDALREATGKDICVVAASERRIQKGLDEHYGLPTAQPIGPEEEFFDLELAPQPVLKTRRPTAAPKAAPTSAGTTAEPPAAIPEAVVTNIKSKFDLREFLGTGRGIVVAAVALVAFLAVGKFAYDWITGKDIPVSGHFEADTVDLQMTIPATGWLYAPSADEEEDVGYLNVSMSLLYRGKTISKPDDLLALLHITGPFPPNAAKRDLDKLILGLNTGINSQMSFGSFRANQHECGYSERREGLTVECTGSAVYKDVNYDITGFLWFERDSSIVMAVFLTQGEFASFDDEIDSIIESIDIQ